MGVLNRCYHYFNHSAIFKHTSVFTRASSLHMSGFIIATCRWVLLDCVSNLNNNNDLCTKSGFQVGKLLVHHSYLSLAFIETITKIPYWKLCVCSVGR